MTAPVFFSLPPDAGDHAARCAAPGCPWHTIPRTGCSAERDTSRRSRRHVRDTGHEVRITVTRTHGYRPRNED